MARQTRKKGTYKVYIFRHSVSCSNLARKIKNTLDANLYTDPELTREGKEMAIKLRPYAQKFIRKPYVVGVSYLLRTHQTAQLLLKPKKMYIIPYISELGKWYQENTPIPSDLQKQLLEEKLDNASLIPLRDYTYFKDVKPLSETKQLHEFYKWLGKHLPAITNHGNKSLALISHWGFMSDIIKSYSGFEAYTIRNCELLELEFTVKNGMAHLEKLKRGDYAPDSMFEWNADRQFQDHGCRLPVGPYRKTRKQSKTKTTKTTKTATTLP